MNNTPIDNNSHQSEIEQLRSQVDTLKEDTQKRFIEGEHRFTHIIKNLITSLSEEKYRKEAFISLAGWLFSRQKLTAISIGIGGFVALIATLFALEANEIAYVQNELTEGQRRSATNIELTNILDKVDDEAKPYLDACSGDINDENKKNRLLEKTEGCVKRESLNEECVPSKDENCVPKFIPLSLTLEGRISGLLQALRPYRFLEATDCAEKTIFEELLSWIKSFLFRNSYQLGCQKLSKPLSPERGQALLAIVNARVKINNKYLFHKADLSNANLREVNLSNANLFMANLREANLSGANLFMTNLINSNFTKATLFRANLMGADTKKSNLNSAYLGGTNLVGANLKEANLANAYLTNAKYNTKQYTDVDGITYNPTKFPKNFNPKEHGMIEVNE